MSRKVANLPNALTGLRFLLSFVFFLLARPDMTLPPPFGAGLSPWMVMAIAAREFLVTGLRSYAESAGWSFPATWLGKSKMATQFGCLCASLVYLAHFTKETWAHWTMAGCLWLTVGVTVGSCGTYVARFVALVRSGES